jgi:hypothetical protein
MSNTLQTEFDKLIADQAELRKQFQDKAQGLFKNITKEFFEKNPGVTAFVWTQYTPYFNDGDTCEFGVNDVTFTNAPDPENVQWEEYEGEEEGVWTANNVKYVLESDRSYYKEDADKIRAAGGVDPESCQLMSDAIGSSEMSDVMLAMFGDHVKIIATREGFDVEDYSHD